MIKTTYSFVIVISCYLFFLYSCQSRYGYRTKVRVHDSQVFIPIDSMKVNEKEEVSMDATDHQISSSHMIDTSIDRMDESVDVKKDIVLQKEQLDSVSIEKLHKQATNNSRSSVQTAFLVSGVILALATLLTSIGAISMADPNYPPEAGISPFLFFGVLLLLVFMISFIIAIIMWVVHDVREHQVPSKNR